MSLMIVDLIERGHRIHITNRPGVSQAGDDPLIEIAKGTGDRMLGNAPPSFTRYDVTYPTSRYSRITVCWGTAEGAVKYALNLNLDKLEADQEKEEEDEISSR